MKHVPAKEDRLFYVRQGQEAIRKALSMLEDKEGWKVEIAEVTAKFPIQSSELTWIKRSQSEFFFQLCVFVAPFKNNGDMICSKVVPGARRVFRLEAVLDAGVDELYDLLFVRVEEMHQWNPSIQHIKVSCWPSIDLEFAANNWIFHQQLNL